MTSQELGGVVLLLGYLGLLLLAIRAFGIRRVLWFFVVLVILGVKVAFRSLDVITGSGRRY